MVCVQCMCFDEIHFFLSTASISLRAEAPIKRNPPFFCRAEQMKFTCEVQNGVSLLWASEPDICCGTSIAYATSDVVGETRRRGNYQANLTHIERHLPFSNFSSDLVTTSVSGNSVTVSCGDQLSFCSSHAAKTTVNITSKCVFSAS